MHERGVTLALMKRVEEEVGATGEERITTLRFRIGALSDVDPVWLERDLADQSARRWGYAPEMVFEQSDDAGDANALGVTLVSIGVEARS
jgi:hypothetical protein